MSFIEVLQRSQTAADSQSLALRLSVNVGDRIAQLVLERIATPEVTAVESLEATERGEGGFGSTGGFISKAAETVTAASSQLLGNETKKE